jgi:hypothetical protein
MSTSLLYHAFGLRGYRYVNAMYLEGHTAFRVEPKPEGLRCAACGSREVVHRGSVYRTFRTVPIGGKGVLIGLEVPRLGCATPGLRLPRSGVLQAQNLRHPRDEVRISRMNPLRQVEQVSTAASIAWGDCRRKTKTADDGLTASLPIGRWRGSRCAAVARGEAAARGLARRRRSAHQRPKRPSRLPES